jgi:hypothetical protein
MSKPFVMRPLWLAAAMLPAIAAAAESIDRPAVNTGDQWVYRVTVEKGPSGWNQVRNEVTVSRTTATTIFLSIKQIGAPQPPTERFTGKDWSFSRDVNGKETVVNQPFSFPLSVNKTWSVNYTEQNPNRNHKSETYALPYTVIGWEDIEVPAGKFHALKIECEGRWQAERAPGQSVVQGAESSAGGTSMTTNVEQHPAGETSGRLYRAFWYVPAIKRWAKSIEEDYSSGGVRHERTTQELESFNAAS